MNNTGIFYLTQILILKKIEKEFVIESSVLAWIRIQIRIEQKCWIRIRIKSIRIHNPENNYWFLNFSDRPFNPKDSFQ
jgi:hypothetical protein